VAITVCRIMKCLRKESSCQQREYSVHLTVLADVYRPYKSEMSCLKSREWNFVILLQRLHNCTSSECSREFFVQTKHMCSTTSVTPTCRTATTWLEGREGKQKCQGHELLAYTNEYSSNELTVWTKIASKLHRLKKCCLPSILAYVSPRTNWTPTQRVCGLFPPNKLLYHEVDQSSPYSTHIEATTVRSFIPLPLTPTLRGAKCRNNWGFATRGFELVCPVEQAT
jgi:hypothetical protein